MSDLFPVAGAKIYIGAAMSLPNADVSDTDFSSVTWTEIADWTNCGSYGDASQLITTQVISRGRDLKQKGTKNAGQMQNQFGINSDDPGQLALQAASQSNSNFPFKIIWNDAPPAESSEVTITIATPGVVSWTSHPFASGDQVKFTTTGALPTGLTVGTTYYVEPIDADSFSVSATKGGSAIDTSGTQSGVHTATSVPIGTTDMFIALVMSASIAGGGANTVKQLNSTFEINTNIVSTPASPAN